MSNGAGLQDTMALGIHAVCLPRKHFRSRREVGGLHEAAYATHPLNVKAA
jgi:hypothetical protein